MVELLFEHRIINFLSELSSPKCLFQEVACAERSHTLAAVSSNVWWDSNSTRLYANTKCHTR